VSWRTAALAVAAGAAMVLAFAPARQYPVAWISLAVLAHLWMRATPRACFWHGFAFGIGLFGAGVSWVYVSLSRFGGMPPALAAFATLCFCALLALFPAAAGWLQARLPGRDALRALLLIPAAWTLAEWLKSWVLGGFPWLSAGYAAVGWPVQGLAPLTGVFGLTFVTAVIGGLLWLVWRSGARWKAFAALLLILGATQLLRLVEWTRPEGARVAVALLQGNIAQDLKFAPERYARILETYARMVEETRARLIVLPETALPRLHDRVDPAYYARLAQAAKRNGGDLILGVPYHEAPGRYYNSVLTLGISPTQVYHKRHLVPFGEFVPAGLGWVMRWLSIPYSDFSSGAERQAPLALAGQKVAVNICYEDAFGDEIIRQLPEATLLVNVSNVAWFGDSLAPAQHLQIAQLRAIETGRMHLTATNSGVTAAIERDGSVPLRLPPFEEGRLVFAAQGYAGATPYVRLGDWPIILLCVLGLCVAAARSRLVRSQ
jgi:apolipoprotein N-acyltransferase